MNCIRLLSQLKAEGKREKPTNNQSFSLSCHQMCMLVSLRQQIMSYAWTSVNACSLKSGLCNQKFVPKAKPQLAFIIQGVLSLRWQVESSLTCSRLELKKLADFPANTWSGILKASWKLFQKFHNLKFFSFLCLPRCLPVFVSFFIQNLLSVCQVAKTWLIIKFFKIIMKDTLKLCFSLGWCTYLQQKWSFM